jgi:ribonuclease VapC
MRMAVDASALLAILLGEEDGPALLSKLVAAEKCWISTVNWWEVQARILSRYGEAGLEKSATWLQGLGLVIEPVTLQQATVALAAFGTYQARAARLNMGDCFAYALARTKDVPLLYKGNDFRHTDLLQA